MSASKSLPARPSLDSLRKQAKKLARASAAGDRDALSRVRAQLSGVGAPLTQRNAQLVVAREYGFAGWQELVAEVGRRLGTGLEWAAQRAEQLIHDNDVDGLKKLLAEYPALLSWQADDEDGGLLGMATSAFGDAGDADREGWFTRGECAELLIDAGATVKLDVCEGLLRSRARGLLQLFDRKGLLPRTLKFRAALGDFADVRATLDAQARDLKSVNEAFSCACRFGHDDVASLLLERSVALDTELGKRIDSRTDRASFIATFAKPGFAQVVELGPWPVFVMEQVWRALHGNDLPAFVAELQREPWLLTEAWLDFQNGLIETASFNHDRGQFITAFFELEPAILRRRPPYPSRAVEWAVMYANTHLLPLLTRIWPVPDDLPYAAGVGDLARVKLWFDGGGAIRDIEAHYPYNDSQARGHLRWYVPTAQQVLDVAFAFAVTNRHFDVADFLLERGADINTRWSSHEPASILHNLVFIPGSRESMRFLVERGIDLTIKDYRWNATAEGWARHALRDETMAAWLAEEQRQREPKR
jgi:hypothetical protein